MAGDWIVGDVNCTATPDNIACTLDDVGEGMGGLFSDIAVPIGTILLVVGIVGGVVAIFYAISKAIGNRVK